MTQSVRRKSKSDKLLVTGVDSMLGSNLALSLSDRFSVVGVCARRGTSFDFCRTVHCDPAKPARLAALVRRESPEWIIHCGPLCRSGWDAPQDDSVDAKREASVCAALAAAAEKAGGFLTLVSSDAVFAGPRMFHDEQAPATGRRPFAQAILAAEKALDGADALIVRTHAYGWSPAGAELGLAERVWRALTEGDLPALSPDRHATPILGSHLAEVLLSAYLHELRGLCHIAGAERTSEYRFASELAIALGLGSPRFPIAEPQAEEGEAPHIDETSMCTRRARGALDYPMPMLREGLDRFAEQAANGIRIRLQSSNGKTPARTNAA